jgi:DNA-nicking Smr family endonuclease
VKKTGRKNRKRQDSRDLSGPSVVEIPITGTLDLHTFSPGEIEPLLDDYLQECRKRGIPEVRIIHGKGRGVQRRRVHSYLSRSSLIQSFHEADPGGGGWGATIALLREG